GAMHIVSRTMTFSRAFSASNPSMDTLLSGRIRCSTDAAPALFPVEPAYRGPRTCPGRRDAGRILAGPVLELVDLHRRFRDVVALDGVSFTVPEGRIVGFVGRNGAGKTTAMRIALGVLDADAGQVRWRGAPVDTAARRHFGYMPEERGLYPKMRVLEQLVYLARLRGVPKPKARASAEQLLATLEVVVLVDRGRVAAHGTIEELRASRARNLWQVRLRGAPAQWWEVIPGTTPVQRDDGTVVLELATSTDPQRVLDVARSAGDVLAF